MPLCRSLLSAALLQQLTSACLQVPPPSRGDQHSSPGVLPSTHCGAHLPPTRGTTCSGCSRINFALRPRNESEGCRHKVGVVPWRFCSCVCSCVCSCASSSVRAPAPASAHVPPDVCAFAGMCACMAPADAVDTMSSPERLLSKRCQTRADRSRYKNNS